MNQLDRIAKEYLAAVGVVSAALKEFYRRDLFRPGMDADTMAEAILARLAAHKPPILLEMEDDGPA